MWKKNTIHYHLSDGVIGVSKPKQEERIETIFSLKNVVTVSI